jgi:hypothetical protein
MPPFGPIKRSDLVTYLRKWGLDGHTKGRSETAPGSSKPQRSPNPENIYETL